MVLVLFYVKLYILLYIIPERIYHLNNMIHIMDLVIMRRVL
nr:MAG TPA: hypothetical protein [Crassvirales sp.]